MVSRWPTMATPATAMPAADSGTRPLKVSQPTKSSVTASTAATHTFAASAYHTCLPATL
jgi:hypothetical protein